MKNIDTDLMGDSRQIITSVSGDRTGMAFWLLNTSGTPTPVTVGDFGSTGEVQFTITYKVQ